MSINHTPKTWGSELLTSADLNAEVKALWDGLQGAWTSYTPVWGSSGTAPAKGNGTLTGSYRRVGKTIDYQIALTIGSSTTNGTGLYSFTIPVQAGWSVLTPVGVAVIRNDGSSANATRGVLLLTDSTIGLLSDDGDRVSATSPFTPDTGDKYLITGRYEAA